MEHHWQRGRHHLHTQKRNRPRIRESTPDPKADRWIEAKTPRNADGKNHAIAGVFRVSHLPLVAEEAIDELAADLGPDSAAALEFVRGFAVMWPRRLASLGEAFASGSFDAARDAAGSIRVSAAMVGAPRLEAAGVRMLELAYAEDYETSRGGLPDLKIIGDETVEELSRIYLSMAPDR